VTYREAVQSAKRAYLYRVLSEAGGNMTKAAALAGIHRTSFYDLLKRHGIKVENRKYVRTMG
jgi:transcriptional regulator of acetoin/glycerol metabolism